MADVILELGAELDGGSISKIKADLAAALASASYNIKVNADTKALSDLKSQIQNLSAQPVLVKIGVDKAALAAAAQEIQKTLAAAMSGGSGGGGSGASGPGIASANKMTDQLIASIKAGAQAGADAARIATAQIVVEGEKQLQAQKTADGQALRNSQDALLAKRQAQKTADSVSLADKQAALKKEIDAEAAANKIKVDDAKSANALLQKEKQIAGQLAVVNAQADKDASVAKIKTDSAEAIEASRAEGRNAALALKQQQQDQQTAILKLYQQAAVYYQAANIMGKLGIPGAGAITTIGSSLQTFGPTLGTAAATGVGVGLAGLTVGVDVVKDSLKTFGTYETSLTKIKNLTGSSADEIKTFKGQIETLAQETGRSQIELAGGLYYIASSGFKGADAFKILDASVKASVAGMGDVQTIADVVTSMMNAYEISASDSFRVTDKLISAVREGKAEPAQFARSLGQVLPVARQAGLSLEETLGALSAMTLQTGNASQATTSLKQAIQSLVAPSAEARKELDFIYGKGKGVETVRVKLQDEGLQSALADIFQKTGGNIPSLDAIFGNIRGLVGVLQLANGDFEKFGQITDRIIKDVGLTVDGANNSAKTYENTLARMETATENFRIKLGGLAAPIVIPLLIKATSSIDDATTTLLALMGQSDPAKTADLQDRQIKELESRGWFDNLISAALPVANLVLHGAQPGIAALPILKTAQADRRRKEEENRNRSSVVGLVNDTLRWGVNPGQSPTERFVQDQKLRWDILSPDQQWQLREAQKNLPTTGFPEYFSPAVKMGPAGWRDPNARTFGGIRRDQGVDSTALQENYAKATEDAIDSRKEAVKLATELNKQIAGDLTKSIDALIQQGERYDDFYGKYNDILKKIDETPDTLTTMVRGGKSVTAKTLASEQAKIADLELRVKIDEINGRIRNAGLGKGKTSDANDLRNLRDQSADAAAAARAAQLAGLKAGQGDVTTLTKDNPKFQAAYDEMDKALKAYGRGTYDTFKGTFDEALKSSIGDTKTFNSLLANGGELLGAFAQKAGLLNSSGFVTTLGEAALQMKFLRDNATGEWLKGDSLVKGLGNYGEALQNFKNDMLQINQYLSGEKKVTQADAIANGYITDTNNIAKTGFVTPTAGGGGRQKTTEEQFAELNATGGWMAAALRKNGLTNLTGGATNPIAGAISLKVGMVFGDNKETYEDALGELQKSVDATKVAIKLRAEIVSLGLSPDAAINNKGRDGLAGEIDSVLGKPEDWLDGVQKITLPNVKLTVDNVDTSDVSKEAEAKVGALKPEAKVSMQIDVSSPTLINQDALVASVDAQVEALIGSSVYQYVKKNVEKYKGTVELPGYASGTDFVPSSGLAKVGEDGPEIVWLPRGARVANAAQTSRMGSPDFRTAREAQRNFFGGVSGSASTSITNVSVDARGAAEPKRTREQAAKGVSMALMGQYTSRRARETGEK